MKVSQCLHLWTVAASWAVPMACRYPKDACFRRCCFMIRNSIIILALGRVFDNTLLHWRIYPSKSMECLQFAGLQSLIS